MKNIYSLIIISFLLFSLPIMSFSQNDYKAAFFVELNTGYSPEGSKVVLTHLETEEVFIEYVNENSYAMFNELPNGEFEYSVSMDLYYPESGYFEIIEEYFIFEVHLVEAKCPIENLEVAQDCQDLNISWDKPSPCWATIIDPETPEVNVHSYQLFLNGELFEEQIINCEYIIDNIEGGINTIAVRALYETGYSIMVEEIVSTNFHLRPHQLMGTTPNWNNIELTWENPLTDVEYDISYDNYGEIVSYGNNESTTFSVAVKWEKELLDVFNGFLIQEISFFPMAENAVYTIKVWKGDNAAILVYSQEIVDWVPNSWNTIPIENVIVPIDETEDLWIGYEISSNDEFTVGMSSNLTQPYYSDLIKTEDGEWKSLSNDYGINNNNLISAKLISSVYCPDPYYGIDRRDDNSGELETIAYYYSGNYYIDYDVFLVPGTPILTYTVYAIYSDTCSVNSQVDMVFIDVKENTEIGDVNIYPNPSNGNFNIDVPNTAKYITIINNLSEQVYKIAISERNNLGIDVNFLTSGIYFINIYTEEKRIAVKKLIIN